MASGEREHRESWSLSGGGEQRAAAGEGVENGLRREHSRGASFLSFCVGSFARDERNFPLGTVRSPLSFSSPSPLFVSRSLTPRPLFSALRPLSSLLDFLAPSFPRERPLSDLLESPARTKTGATRAVRRGEEEKPRTQKRKRRTAIDLLPLLLLRPLLVSFFLEGGASPRAPPSFSSSTPRFSCSTS